MSTNNGGVNILIPMAGLGKRFRDVGYNVPKPLIEIQGKTMVEWAMKSFDFLDKVEDYHIIFIIAKEEVEKFSLDQKLKTLFPHNSSVLVLDERTRGQAETCLKAKEYIDNNSKLFIYNCDTYSTSKIWDEIEREDPDGILTCFIADHPRYSYAKVDAKTGYVVETAEKKVISQYATSGMYYFRKGSEFVKAAEEMISGNELSNNEFYVAPLYNKLIQQGKKIKVVLVNKNIVMGTSEELLHIPQLV